MIDSASTISQCEEHMHKAVEHLDNELTKVRAGAANPHINAEHNGQRLFSRKLVGDGKARGTRNKAQLRLCR